MTVSLNDSVKYIGVDDLDLDLFESQYIVPDGMSYNSYVILDKKVAVMDTSDARKGEEWKANLVEALAGREPDYLVVHHMEPDHSALIAWALGAYPGLVLVASAKAIQMLGQFFDGIDLAGRTQTVKEGDVLELGKHSLRFFAAPMVHWPEVMVSFDAADGALYSADAFGKFGALSKCGFYGRDDDDWACEGRRYYFNIVGKYGAQVQALLAKVGKLPVKTIRPLHGPVLEDNLGDYVSLYDTWSRYEPESDGIFIAVASIHGGTLEAAERFADILRAKGARKVVLSDLCRSDIAENVEDAFRYPTMVLAASSYDAGLFTPMYEFLHRLQIKNYSNRRVALIENGSWAPSAARVMKEMVGNMKNIELVEQVVTIRSRMKATDLPALEALADAVLS
ncbi:MAG: FprA family A-type flavoprotein [Bacteroidales bacterium]|nr:FprA family A-type flavoprotein [Bacteroidales bacterium]MBR4479022.1 FprA family A-type flavoprotein [Bacteroidales bacterium]